MFVIVGLGNPGREYDGTRHNAGFLVLDQIAEEYGISMDMKKHRAYCGKGMINGQKIILAKPQTYMNNSGESVRSLTDYYKIDCEQELLVIYDDISLDVGQIRIRKKGSAGGHNGVKSIISHLGTMNFQRIKMGVGHKPPKYDQVDFVLGRFAGNDKVQMEESIKRAVPAAVMIVDGRIDEAMNQYNRKDS